MKIAVFTGSFDPFTSGHLDIARRALKLFDTVIIGVASNRAKPGLFPLEQRMSLIDAVLSEEIQAPDRARVRCELVPGLVAEFARRAGAAALIRGVRSVGEFEAERAMAALNRQLTGIETVLIPASPELEAVSSTALKEIAVFGGDIANLAPRIVALAVKERLGVP